MARNVLKNYALFVDGLGFFGEIDSVTLPTLSEVGDDHRGAGMDGSTWIPLGMEPMEMTFVVVSHSPEAMELFGRSAPKHFNVLLKSAHTDTNNSAVRPGVIAARGHVSSFEPGEWKAGEKAMATFTMKLIYYRVEVAGRVSIEIDIENAVKVIGGVDQLAAERAALGI